VGQASRLSFESVADWAGRAVRPTLRMSGALGHGSVRVLGGGVVELVDDLLARAILDQLWFRMAQIKGRAQQVKGFLEASGWLGFDKRTEPRRRFIDRGCAQAERHPAKRTQRVNGQGELRDLPVHSRSFDQQRLATTGLLHLAVGEFRDLQFSGQRLRDASQLARCLQPGQKISE